ncbi:MAG: hypothetical protein RI897_2241 [Verrucomicrobiota bacterium]
MHRLMATSSPTATLRQKTAVIHPANKHLASRTLLLEMTLQTQRRIPLRQQIRIHRTMRPMTRRAPLPHRLMLKYMRPALRRMTLQTPLVQRHQSQTPNPMRRPLVRIVAITTVQTSLTQRMMTRPHKLRARVQMTLKTQTHVILRIQNVPRLRRIRMQTARPMTRFTTRLNRIIPQPHQPRMIRILETRHNPIMAIRTNRTPHILSPRYPWRRHHGLRQRPARHHHQSRRHHQPAGLPPAAFL